jgi:hypothetical protein
MPTPTTTVKAICENMYSLIRDLSPTSLQHLKFRQADLDTEFLAQADEGQVRPRTFDIEDVGPYEEVTVSDGEIESIRTTIEVRVAYPKAGNYGSARVARRSLMDAMRADMHLIDGAVGLRGYANYVSGQHASIRQPGDPLVERETCWILALPFAVHLYRSVS